ncbi:hypothetical protein DMN50_19060 [Priestia megaterium]|nr:hypothetical protein DMN50_19060 [Priestia megaterium]
MIKLLCRTESQAEVIEREGLYNIKLHFNLIPEEASLMISPLLREQYTPIETTTLLENLNVTELGEFYRVKAVKDGTELHRVIKIGTVGIPAERESEVFKTIIRDKHTFLTYVAFLLSDDYILSALEQMVKKKKGSDQWDLKSFDIPVLYEHMLKAAARSPEKFEDVETIINIIEDKDIIPLEFISLYETFQKASKKVRR